MIILQEENKHINFINHLNKVLPTKTNVKLWENPDCGIVVFNYPDGTKDEGYAIYDVEEKLILWPSKNEEKVAYESLAHEYVHHWQTEKGLDNTNEEEAEILAQDIYEKYIKKST
jgi:Zn-dependent peptidase ImmA (M78 family)